MEILTDYNDLVGKTIAFVHMAQFAEQITIATEDKKVLMAVMEGDEDSDRKEVQVLYPAQVMQRLEKHEWLRNELGELGIFDLQAYRKELKAKQAEQSRLAAEEKVKRDLQKLEELKAMYEPEPLTNG